jgi:hypothetical protein
MRSTNSDLDCDGCHERIEMFKGQVGHAQMGNDALGLSVTPFDSVLFMARSKEEVETR